MATVGYISGGGTAESGLNYANQVACRLTMPANGWITNAHAVFGGWNTNPWSAICLWAMNNGGLIWASGGFYPGTGPSQQNVTAPNLRIPAGASFWLGFWRDPNGDAQWTTDTAVATNWAADTVPGGPTTFYPAIGAYGPGQLSAYVDYTANAVPNQGAWQSPTPSGTISDTNPTFSGTTPQNPADSAYESVSQIRWQITRTDTGQTVFDHYWSVNANIPSWSHKPSDFGLSLQPGVPYSSLFAYADSWGSWSGWTASATTFTINAGPNAPTASSPTGKVNTVSGLDFTANYTHGSGLAAQSVQVQVLDPSGSTVLQDSGVVSQSVASGSNYTVTQWFPDLPWGSAFQWWTRAQDTSGVWGPWSALAKFNTDGAPGAPVPQGPVTGAIIPGGTAVTLSASFMDPDSDPLTSITWDLYDLTAAAEVAGYPATVTGSFASGSTQTRVVTSSLSAGHQYQWRAQSSDGTLTGPWSPWSTFTYTTPPSVTVTSPTAGQVEPSASASIQITYGGSAAKAYDRTYVYDTTNGGNALVLDSGNVAGARTSWPLPYSTLANGHSYSLTVEVTDVNGLTATSAPVAFSASWTVTSGPNMQLLVDGIDRTANMLQDQWYVSQDWGRQGDTAQVELLDEHPDGSPSFHVRPMATVEIRDLNLGALLFGGVVTQHDWIRNSPNMTTWRLRCSSPAVYLQNRIVSSDYTNWTADAIVRDMLAQANCGITGNHVMPGPLIPKFKGLNHTVAQAMQKLCHLASTTTTYGWWVDGNSDLHFASTTQADAEPSGVTLTDSVTAAATTTTGYYQNDTQTYYQWDASSLKTRVLVQGGAITRSFTEQFVGDGTTRSFRLSYPLQTNPLNATVLVGGAAVPVSDQSGATTPWLLVQGAPGVWSLSTQPGGAPPSSGTVVSITYNYTAPVIAQVQSPAGISAVQGPNQGLFDALITDSSLTGLDAAQARALREIEEYALSQERVVLMTTEDWPGWLHVGQSFQFANALMPDSQNNWAAGINSTYLVIQSRASGVAGGYRTLQITAVRI